jgi:hypothetical protein
VGRLSQRGGLLRSSVIRTPGNSFSSPSSGLRTPKQGVWGAGKNFAQEWEEEEMLKRVRQRDLRDSENDRVCDWWR